MTSLFGDIWKRADRAARDRGLVTVACLTASGNTDQLVYHLGLARENGLTEAELIEAITHLAFYAGPRPWPPWPWRRKSSATKPDPPIDDETTSLSQKETLSNRTHRTDDEEPTRAVRR